MFENIGKNTNWPIRCLSFFLAINKEHWIDIDDLETYKLLGVTSRGQGVQIKRIVTGSELRMRKYQVASANQLMWCKVDTKNGAFSITRDMHKGSMVSPNMCLADIDMTKCIPDFLQLFFQLPVVYEGLTASSLGTTNRQYLKPTELLDVVKLHLPSLPEQRRIVAKAGEILSRMKKAQKLKALIIQEIDSLVDTKLKQIVLEVEKKKLWEFGPIPEYAEVNPSRKGQIDLLPDTFVSFVPMSAVDGITGKITEKHVKEYYKVSKGYTWFKGGDVIFARITPCMENGKSAIAINLENNHGFGSTEFHVLRPGSKILAEWLHILVRSKDFRRDAKSHFKGTAGQQRVPQSFLEQKVIPVPSISKQKELISYFKQIKEKVADINKLEHEITIKSNALLPSILDKAFKGEL